MNALVRFVEDRSLLVPPGYKVSTGFVDVFKVRLVNRARMAVGDFDRAYQKRLQTGDAHPFPCPNGEWDGDMFLLADGRHEWMATVALGHAKMMVAWVEPA